MEERTQNVGAPADEQHGSLCAMAHAACRAGVVTCVVFLPVKTSSAVAEAVGENMGSPAPAVGQGEEKSSFVMSLPGLALLYSGVRATDAHLGDRRSFLLISSCIRRWKAECF